MEAQDVADLVESTQAELGKAHITNLASRLQRHIAMTHLMRKGKVKFKTGGIASRVNVMKTHSGAARHVGLFSQDISIVGDAFAHGEVPWRFTETHYMFDRHEPEFNSGEAEIFDLIKGRKTDAYMSLADLLETTVWGKPADSTDVTTPWGVKMFLVANASKGFNGGDPSGFAGGYAGITGASVPRWKNWTDTYVNMTEEDLGDAMDEAFTKTDFRAPVNFIPAYGAAPHDFSIYMNYATRLGLKKMARNQNDNLGTDLDAYEGKVRFRGVPLEYVPFLDDDTTNPLMFIDWEVVELIFVKGDHFNEHKPKVVGDAHNVVVVHVDLSWNIKCQDRRRHAYLYQA